MHEHMGDSSFCEEKEANRSQDDVECVSSTTSTTDQASSPDAGLDVCNEVERRPETAASHSCEILASSDTQSWQDMRHHGKSALQRAMLATAAFGVIHKASGTILPALLGPKLMKAVWRSKDPQHRLYFAEMIGSTVHGAFVGISALLIVVARRQQHGLNVDIFKHYPPWFDVMFSASAGWSLWDMGVMFGSGEPLVMWLHHLIVLSGSLLIQCYRRAAFFPAAFGLTELTVIPHNAMWYLSALGLRASNQRLEARLALIRAVFFFVFRLPIGPGTIAYAMRVHGGAEFWRRYRALSPVIQGATGFNVLVLSVLNFIWTGGAVLSAYRKTSRLAA